MKKLTLISLIAGSLGATPAFAYVERAFPPVNPVYGLNTFYVSGDFGAGALATPAKNLPDTSDTVSSSYFNTFFSGGGSIGYRRAINPMFSLGVEGGYDYNGKAQYKQSYAYYPPYYGEDTITNNITSQDFHLLSTGTFYFYNGFNVFGKAGVADVHQTLRVNYNNPWDIVPVNLGDETTNAYKPMVATGIGYSFRNVDIYAQYSHIFGDNAQDFSDLFNSDGTMKIVSVDTFKLGFAVGIKV